MCLIAMSLTFTHQFSLSPRLAATSVAHQVRARKAPSLCDTGVNDRRRVEDAVRFFRNAENAFRAIDEDNSGAISLEEFLRFVNDNGEWQDVFTAVELFEK